MAVTGTPDSGRVPRVSFRAMTEADLPLVATWLREAHVQRWWNDPSAADRVEAKYLPRIRGEEPTEMMIVLCDGAEVGMIQRYLLSDHPDWVRSLAPVGLSIDDPSTIAGIDYAIGVPDLIGKGIGSRVVADFSRDLFVRHPTVDKIVVTPQAANCPSCRVLEKAGYALVWTGMLDSSDPGDAGSAAAYVLTRG